MLYSVACEVQVNDVSVAELLEDGRDMAERLGLFGRRYTMEQAAAFKKLSDDWQRQTAQVAWGAYSWLTLNIYYTAVKPIAFPPHFPIPGNMPSESNKNRFKGKTFAALCKFWAVIQEVAAVYSFHQSSSERDIPLSFAEVKYQQLLNWADGLEEACVRGDHSPDDVITMHILFHCAIIDIFRPFEREREVQNLASFTSADSSVQSVIRASANQLKQLLLACRLQNHGALNIMLIGTAVLHVSHVMLRDSTVPKSNSRNSRNPMRGSELEYDPEWRFYFFLCIANCRELALCFPVFVSVGRGLLGMALRTRAVTASEARAWSQALQAHSRHHTAAVRRGDFGAFFMDFNLATTAPQDAQVKAVAEKFEELVMFDEFTQNMDFVSRNNAVQQHSSGEGV